MCEGAGRGGQIYVQEGAGQGEREGGVYESKEKGQGEWGVGWGRRGWGRAGEGGGAEESRGKVNECLKAGGGQV